MPRLPLRRSTINIHACIRLIGIPGMSPSNRDLTQPHPALPSAAPCSKTSGPCGAGLRGSTADACVRGGLSLKSRLEQLVSRKVNETDAAWTRLLRLRVTLLQPAERKRSVVAVSVREKKLSQMCWNDAKVFPEETASSTCCFCSEKLNDFRSISE